MKLLKHHQNNEWIAFVTWATVCSPSGISSVLRATLDTTEPESASKIILKYLHQLHLSILQVVIFVNKSLLSYFIICLSVWLFCYALIIVINDYGKRKSIPSVNACNTNFLKYGQELNNFQSQIGLKQGDLRIANLFNIGARNIHKKPKLMPHITSSKFFPMRNGYHTQMTQL